MVDKLRQKEYDKRYRENNREKCLERYRDYSKRNRAKKTAAYLAWRKANPDKAKASTARNREKQKQWMIANKERVRLSQKKWRERNKHKLAEASVRYEHAFRSATPKWLTKEQKQEILSIYKSAQVASEFHEIQYHVDHIEPLRGKTSWGLHVPWNLRRIPAVENIKKSNKALST